MEESTTSTSRDYFETNQEKFGKTNKRDLEMYHSIKILLNNNIRGKIDKKEI